MSLSVDGNIVSCCELANLAAGGRSVPTVSFEAWSTMRTSPLVPSIM